MTTDHALVEALVALASRDGLGEQVDWHDVRAAIFALEETPFGLRDLRQIVARVNDPSVVDTLHDWFQRAASEREEDAENADRASRTVVVPFQRASLAPFISGLVGAAIGTFGAAIAVPLAVASALVFAAASAAVWRLSKREDKARRDARKLDRLAETIEKIKGNKGDS